MAQFAIDEILTTGIQISGFVFDVSNNIGTNGYVLTSTSSGVMWQQDSSNTDLSALSGQIAATGALLNNRINSLSGYANDTFLSGVGVSNYVPRWSGTKLLVTGSIFDLGTGVGIGTTDPVALLTVGSTTIASSEITLQGQYQSSVFNNANIFNFRHGGLNRWRLLTTQNSAASNDFDFSINAINATINAYNAFLTIKGLNGNVGISTTNPTTLLSVGGAGSTTAASGLTFGGDTSANLYRDSSASIRTDGGFYAAGRIRSADYIQFNSNLYSNAFTNPIDINVGNSAGNAWLSAIRFNQGGYVGIGTNQPSGKLHVVSSIAGETVLRADGTNGTLFSVTDDLSDSLMSVNNSAGLPVFEVFADDRVIAGQYGSGDFVLKNNKIGIGTTDPSQKLNVVGSTLFSNSSPSQYVSLIMDDGVSTPVKIGTTLRVVNDGSSPDYSVFEASSSVSNFVILNNGNVGIGTSQPNAKLHVSGSNGHVLYLNQGVTGAQGGLYFQNVDQFALSSARLYFISGDSILFTRGASNLAWAVSQNANVGIGVSNPSEKLTITGAVKILTRDGANFKVGDGSNNPTFLEFDYPDISTSNAYFRIFRNTNTAGGKYFQIFKGDGTATSQTLLNANGDSHINAIAGNLGIGTDSPNHLLNLNTVTADTSIGLYTSNANSSARNWLISANDLAYGDFSLRQSLAISGNPRTSGVSRFYINNNGNIGIATTSPGYSLQIGQNTSGNNIDYSLGILRHGTLTYPGSWTSNPAFKIIDLSDGGPSNVDIYGLINLELPRFQASDTNAEKASLFLISFDTALGPFRIDGKGNTWVGYDRVTTGTNLSSFSTLIYGGLAVGDTYQTTTLSNGQAIFQGNVGIGITNPTVRLQVVNTGAPTSTSTVRIIGATGNGAGPQIEFFKGANQKFSIGAASAITGGFSDDLLLATLNPSSIILAAGVSGFVSFKTDGKVGIGMYAPTTLLSVGGAGSTTAASGITFGSDPEVNLYRSAENVLKTDGSLIITDSLGVGLSPTQKLQVEGVVGNPASIAATQSGIFRISNTTDNAVLDFGIRAGGLGAWIQSTDKTALDYNYPLLLNPNGARVGVGLTTSISGILHVRTPAVGDQTLLVLEHSAGYSNNTENRIDFFDDEAHKIAARIAQYYSTDSNNRWGLKFYTNPSAAINPTPALTLRGNNNVGVGTTSPIERLHVSGNIHVQAESNSVGGNGIYLGDVTNRYLAIRQTSTNKDFAFDTYNNTESWVNRLTILNTGGNVGIGTTTPISSLELYKIPATSGTLQPMLTITSDYPSAITTNFGSSIVFKGRTAGNQLQDNAQISAYNENNNDNGYALGFYTRPTVAAGLLQRLTILRGGNVGVGTTSPDAALHVRGDQVYLYNDLNTNNTYFYARNSSAGNAGIKMKNSQGEWTIIANDRLRFIDDDAGVERLSILSNGNVGIGIVAPTDKIQISGGGISFTTSTGLAVPMLGLTAINVAYIGPYATSTDGNAPTLVVFNQGASVQQTYFYSSGKIAMVLNKEGRLNIAGNAGNTPPALLNVGPTSSVDAVSGMSFGNDSSANLYRSAASIIKTDGSLDVTSNLLVGSDLYVADELGVGVPIANKRFNYGAEVEVANASIQLVLGRLGNATGQGGIGADASNVFAVWNVSGGLSKPFVITQQGNVGIGSETPTQKLDVSGTLKIKSAGTYSDPADNAAFLNYDTVGGILTLSARSNGGNTYMAFRTSNGGTGSEKVRIANNGLVGISSNAPTDFLDFGGAGKNIVFGYAAYGEILNSAASIVGNNVKASPTANSQVRRFANANDQGNFIKLIYNKGVTFHTNITSALNTDISEDTNERMRIDLSGNVGIGTITPSGRLHIVESSATGTRIQLGTNTENASMNAGSTNDLLILNAPYGTNSATISNSGAKWGIKFIGTLEGNQFNSTRKTSAIYAVSEDPTAGYNRGTSLAFYTNAWFDQEYTERMRIFQNGNIGIGTTQPSYKLQIVGSGTPTSPTVLQVAGLNNDGGDAKLIVSQNPGASDLQLLVAGTDVRADGFTANDQYILAGQQLNLFNRGNGSTYNTQIMIGRDGGYGNISFSTAPQNQTAVVRMYIASGGNVGIGTITPSKLLHVHGDSGEILRLSMPSNYTAGAGPQLSFWHRGDEELASIRGVFNESSQGNRANLLFGTRTSDALGVETKMTILHNGNVGIGNTIPTGLLNVIRNSSTAQPIAFFKELFGTPPATNILLLERGNNLTAANQLSSNAGLRIRDHLVNYSLSVEDHNSNVNFAISGTRVMLGSRGTDSLLNIGGVSSTLAASGITFGQDPQVNLYRSAEDTLRTDAAFTNGNITLLGGDLLFASDGGGDGFQFDYYQGKMYIGNYGATAWHMVIQDNGYVGIGTTQPTGKLHVVSTVAGETVLRADGTNGTLFSVVDDLSDSLMSVNNSAGLPVLEVFADDRVVAGQYGSGDFVVTSNKVGIGRTNPGEKLDVNGSIRLGVTVSNTIGTSNVSSLQTQAINIQPNSSTDTLYIRNLSAGNYQLQTVTASANGGNLHLQPYGGNVGIGTTAPVVILDVVGPLSNFPTGTGTTTRAVNLRLRNSDSNLVLDIGGNGGNGNWLQSTSRADLSLVYSLLLNPNGGNVGIGTTNPSSKLHIYDNGGSFRTDLDATYHMGIFNEYVSTYVTRTKFGRYSNTSNLEIYYDIAGTEEARITRNLSTAVLKFNRSSTTDMIIDGVGNVGIGTNAPTNTLQVVGQIAIKGNESADNAKIYIQASDNSNRYTVETDLDANTNNDLLIFRSNTVDNMIVLKGNGNVGIGTTNPSGKLSVDSVGANTFNVCDSFSSNVRVSVGTINTAGTIYGLIQTYQHNTNSAGVSPLNIQPFGGNVGIGLTVPTDKIQISGGGISFTSSTGLAIPMLGVTATNVAYVGPYTTTAEGVSPSLVLFNQGASVQQTWFYSSGRVAMVLNKEGRLHIGNINNTPNCLLSVGPSSSTTAVSGICFGNDAEANLYRSAEDTIKTDGNLIVVGNVTAANLVSGNGTANYITKWNGTKSIANSQIFDDGTYVGVNTAVNTTYRLQVNGSFAATTKSFDITHPTISGKRLVYASLEGPENGVYFRGRNNNNEINLPHYWSGLVHDDSITVDLTSIGKRKDGRIRNYSVDQIGHNKVYIYTDSDDNIYDYYYTIFAERKDVSKLVIERDME